MRNVLLLTTGSLALGLDAFVVAGILPLVGADMHLSASAVGQMVTVFTLSYALLAPVFATILTGRSLRGVLLVALVVFTIGNIATIVATSLPLLLVSRAVAGAGAGLYSPMSVAAAAGLVGPERRGRALALITAGMSSGVVVGVPLGLLLAQHAGWRSTIWLVIGISAVAFVGIAVLLPTLPGGASAPSLRARSRVLADRHVLWLLAVTVICSTTSIGAYTYLSTFIHSELHTTDMTPFLWVWGIGGLVGSFAVGHVIDRWPDTRVLVSVILGAQGLALLVLPLAGYAVVALLPVLFVWGVAGWGAIAPQQHRMLALRGKDGPVAVSLNSSATYLGNALGAGIGGALLGAGLPVVLLPLMLGIVAAVCAGLNLRTAPTSPSPKDSSVSEPTDGADTSPPAGAQL